ncbi:MAG: bifunctional folylpolyglutamate synthase/dihydrofolate synthase [Treponema sp.]|nr:bifunctional folylpolyglutamate synthase/dihydrofolate synthase [Treponema sp.]
MSAIDDFLEWLDSYLNFERLPQKNIFWLDTIDYLCKRFDNPQDSAPCIHVAGSKGKGSVSKMIASILQEAGYNVGLYTSPHISDFRERIGSARGFFDDEIYEKSIKEIIPLVDSIIPENLPAERPLTWFELVTLYAFLCFRNAKTDWNVFEVGLGGRLDATNIIRPKLCCITPIELEHTEFLGDTIEKIAAEKAGIIKNCTPVLLARQFSEGVNIVLREKAFTRHAPYYFVDELINNSFYSFNQKTHRMHIHLDSPMFNRPVEADMRLLGKMQAQNAAMACIAAKKVLPNVDEAIIERGLEKAYLPGRFEIKQKIEKYPGLTLILDGAHTLNSVKLTVDTLNKLFGSKKINLLFACAADKDVKDMATLFKYRFVHIYVTRPGEKKLSDLNAEITAFKNAELNFTADADYKKIIKQALEESTSDGSVLLVTGSFYLVSEVEELLS